jgi:hypothetical protein
VGRRMQSCPVEAGSAPSRPSPLPFPATEPNAVDLTWSSKMPGWYDRVEACSRLSAAPVSKKPSCSCYGQSEGASSASFGNIR